MVRQNVRVGERIYVNKDRSREREFLVRHDVCVGERESVLGRFARLGRPRQAACAKNGLKAKPRCVSGVCMWVLIPCQLRLPPIQLGCIVVVLLLTYLASSFNPVQRRWMFEFISYHVSAKQSNHFQPN